MKLSDSFLNELRSSRIYVAGHKGLVGSSILSQLKKLDCKNLITRTSSELDLRKQTDVNDFFKTERPDIVFLAAAKVGGIVANDTFRAEFLYDNLLIAANVIEASYRNGIKRLLNLGSSCVYPKMAPQPLKEEYLLTSELEPTNEPYAIAKIAALKMIENYNRQYKTQFLSVMPTNLYGAYDNFDPNHSHVIPGMIYKFHKAKLENALSVSLWGTGEVYREFLYSDDMSEACLVVLDRAHAGQFPGEFINIGTGEDLTIKDLATKIKNVVGYSGKIIWDTSKPNGTPKKQLDISRLKQLGWQPRINLNEGLSLAYNWYLENL